MEWETLMLVVAGPGQQGPRGTKLSLNEAQPRAGIVDYSSVHRTMQETPPQRHEGVGASVANPLKVHALRPAGAFVVNQYAKPDEEAPMVQGQREQFIVDAEALRELLHVWAGEESLRARAGCDPGHRRATGTEGPGQNGLGQVGEGQQTAADMAQAGTEEEEVGRDR
jgi:hypothetical protein